MVGAGPAAAAGAGDPGRHRAAGATSTATGYRDGNDPTRLRRQPDRRDLLHDRHPEHDRVRRHRAVSRRAPGWSTRSSSRRPHRVPGAADRHHPRGARLAGPRDVPDRPVEEEHGTPRRRHRLRHQGPQRRRHPRQQRARPRAASSSSTPAPTALAEAHADGLAVVTGDATRREVLRRAGGGDRRPGHHHHRPRRHQRAGHADRPPAQPRRLHRRRGPRAGERAADAAVRRRLGDHLVRRGRPAARPLVAVADARLGDGGPADLRRGPRGRRARPAGQRGRASSRSRCPTR